MEILVNSAVSGSRHIFDMIPKMPNAEYDAEVLS